MPNYDQRSVAVAKVLELARPDACELVERYGQFLSGRKTWFAHVHVGTRVKGTTMSDILFAALDAESLGMPQIGDPWSDDLPRLCVSDRIPKFVGWDENRSMAKVEVRVSYTLEFSNKGYPLRGSAHLSQIETNLKRNSDGSYSEITHTYGGVTRKATIMPFVAESFQVRNTTEETNDPEYIKQEWINTVNKDVWCGQQPGFWLLSQIEFEVLNWQSSPNRWLFSWTFLRTANPMGWLYKVGFINRDGYQPNDDTTDWIEWYTPKDFDVKFPSTGSPPANEK
jgi:hypothetical protein